MIEAGRSSGVPVAALVGAKEHALKQVQAGVDVIVAQGTEAGGHCGEVSTLCLVPEVLDALAAVGSTTPALAAGGIVTGRQMAACVAMAPPAWTGSVWLTTEEAETAPHTKQKFLGASSATPSGRPAGPESRRDNLFRTGPMPGRPTRVARSRCRCRCSRCSWSRCCAGSTSWPPPGMRAPRPWRPTSSARGGLDEQGEAAREVVLEFIEDYLSAAERLAGSVDDDGVEIRCDPRNRGVLRSAVPVGLAFIPLGLHWAC
jgi:hypothetical protein